MRGKGDLPIKPKASIAPEKSIDELQADNKRLKKENAELERRNYYLHIENDTLQLMNELLKNQGASLIKLTNREKAIVMGALRKDYPLKNLLKIFKMAKSNYCYQQVALGRDDKYANLRCKIRKIYDKSRQIYG